MSCVIGYGILGVMGIWCGVVIVGGWRDTIRIERQLQLRSHPYPYLFDSECR